MSDQMALICAQSKNRRPVITEEMRRKAAQEVVAELIGYREVELVDSEQCVSDIVDATKYHRDDGYKIAKELDDRHHWDCNMTVVESLDGFGRILEGIYDRVEVLWAEENPAEPAFSIGAAVLWRGEPATIFGICDHRPHCYKVRQGEMKEGSYYVVPFEDVAGIGG